MMASEDCASSPFHYVPCSPFLVTKAVPPSRHVPDVDHLRRKVADAVDSPFAIPHQEVPCTPSDNRIDARTSTDGALSPCSSQDTPGDQSVCGRHVRHAARKYGLSGKPSPGTKEIDLFSGENDIFA
ncbi:Hypp2734 [Branchiostoma lanceolatum]|uniref:Hypp2734 protein n=1 Tax=Branchiostoma lanceolatum TaxID=7740 RepID=A0A8J9ZWV7_BRALA|nr:Hypp2734 [Branchiostoma lanceolatum]